MSTERITVDQKIADAFTKQFAAKAGALSVGDPRMPQSTLMAANVQDRVTPAMRIHHEETFGPVTCVVRVNGVQEAVA